MTRRAFRRALPSPASIPPSADLESFHSSLGAPRANEIEERDWARLEEFVEQSGTHTPLTVVIARRAVLEKLCIGRHLLTNCLDPPVFGRRRRLHALAPSQLRLLDHVGNVLRLLV